MKNIASKILILSAFSFFTLTSCEELVDIKPIDELPIADLTKDSLNVQYVLNGAYNLNQGMFPVWRTAVMLGDDFDATAIALKEQGDYQFFPEFRFGPFNGVSDAVWNDGYNTIGRTNIVIDAVDKRIFKASQTTYNRLKGEALFLRATQGFFITQIFSLPYTSNPTSPGMVIRTKLLTADEAAIPVQRSSVAESYTQIEADLNEAINLLPESNGTGVNKWMAKAFLARVQFNKNDYATAYATANDVITNGGYTFAPVEGDSLTPSLPFIQSTTIHPKNVGFIYDIINIVGSDKSGDFRGKFFNSLGANANFTINPDLPSALLGDTSTQFFKQLYGRVNNIRFTRKYRLNTRNIPVIRLVEMYYNRAEAGLQTGTITVNQAIDDLNLVRNATGLDSLVITNPTQAVVIEQIRNDRRGAMIGEPDRLFELKRLNATVRNVPTTDRKSLPKLPVAEINGNRFIQQN